MIMDNSLYIRDFNHLYTDYRERFVSFARTYVYNKELAEDIVMDSLMYYWENRADITGQNIPAYILTTIKHKCLNHLHRLRSREEMEDYLYNRDLWELNLQIATLEACNPEQLFSQEVQQLVNEALASMPEQTREIFIRSRFDNQTHKQISDELGLSTKSVEYHITKALKVLRITLKDYFPAILFISKFF